MSYSHNNNLNLSRYSREYHPPTTNEHQELLATDTLDSPRTGMGSEKYFEKQLNPPDDESENHSTYLGSESQPYRSELLATPHKKPRNFRVRDWQWECLASIFSLACFAAIISVLIAFDNKSLTHWNFVVGFTPNTLVATLSTFSRTALLVPVASCLSQLKWIHLVTASRLLNEIQIFDDASRGPWGSLELVCRMHIKTKLASWGALITISTLAMGPFAQQLISFPLREVHSDGGAFYQSQVYDIGPDPNRPRSILNPDSKSVMNSTIMQGAILNGVFNLSSPVNVSCPGSCRWRDFVTLAVKSTCQNVLHDLERNCTIMGGGWACQYTTPSGFPSAMAYYDLTKQDIPTINELHSGVRLGPTPKASNEKPSSTIMWILLGGPTLSKDRPEPLWSEYLERQGLYECHLRWSARVTRNMSVVNGTFNPGDTEDFELTGLASNEGSSDAPPTWLTFKASGDSFPSRSDRSFNVSMRAHKDIQSYLNTVFNNQGLKLRYGESIVDISGEQVHDFNRFIEIALFEQLYAESPRRPELVNSMAKSMTYAVGQSPGNTKLQATVIDTEQYIRVHWLWVILPLIEVVMSVAFLVCTLIRTQQTGVTAWKSSSIVPFLTVLAGWENKDLAATSLGEVNERSRQMKAQLIPKSGGVQGLHRAAC